MTTKKHQSYSLFVLLLFGLMYAFFTVETSTFLPQNEEIRTFLRKDSTEGEVSTIGKGTLSSPCTGWSAYSQMRRESSAYPECKKWLAEGSTQETFLGQYNQDVFFFNNFARCLDGPGVYLDLGAYQPIRWSNTWLLDRCLGWKGVCVEADPAQAEPFRHQRGCTVVAKAVGLKSASGGLVGGDWGGMVAANYFGEGIKKTISISTLEEILIEAGFLNDHNDTAPLTIDFLSIDIEHNELNAFLAFPWKRLNIRFIVAENIFGTKDVEKYLAIIGYVKVYSLEFDDFYAHLEGPFPLWRPLTDDFGAAALRKEQGYPQYQHKQLYTMSWSAFLKFTEDNKELPP